MLAAKRAGITDVILPKDNGQDLEDIPDEIRDSMNIHLVSEVTEAVGLALAA